MRAPARTRARFRVCPARDGFASSGSQQHRNSLLNLRRGSTTTTHRPHTESPAQPFTNLSSRAYLNPKFNAALMHVKDGMADAKNRSVIRKK